ncbi:hypothetical protein SPHINGO361_150096 [Sphingomonas sp. EC-HK361]|uniref:flagellar hook-length control protein FliK n=1 Tax=Sphingomonas sp. EC-HK361 TaxID=2038397 RepID=UPI001254A470|nr:flagellar hook-length control protein FliK [Sphingomonas sp. EC-HK361]VVT20669.1 hypothetical protein SPHINGO361_150096 [Sphingomonas sp. EC-HK361]
MFQLTSPLMPATGRAGIAGTSAGGVALGGKGAIDLPDFMTFALIGVAPAAPGKVRQDPAGGGEAVPGGTAITPPAGHPEVGGEDGTVLPKLMTASAGDEAVTTADTSVVTVALPLTAPEERGGKPTRVAETRVAKVQERTSPMTEPLAIAPNRAGSAPETSTPVAEKRAKVRRQDAGVALSEAPPQPVTVAVTTQPVALPAAAPIDNVSDVTAMQPPPAVIPSVTQQTATDDRSPILAPAITSSSPAAVAVPAGGFPAKAAASPSIEQPRNSPIRPASGSPTPAPSAPLDDLDLAPSRTIPNSGRVAAVMAMQPRPVDAPAVAPALAPSLAPIARMLDASSRDAPVTSVPQAATPAPSPVTVLPAMPASVASFLASVGPRPVLVPLADATSKASVRTGAVTTPATAVLAPPAPVTPTNAGPAGQLFAEAIHAAAGRSERSTQGDPVSPAAFAASAVGVPATTIAAVADRAPIDMMQGHWPAKMIARIESLRDAADAQDTRIRLIPDALGAIDVAMKRDGDTVRVHLAADRPETRVLIADAQPRLTELGEQRGLKIAASSGQTSGQAMPQDSHQQRGNPAPPQPARPASARAGDQPATNDDDDQRVA